MDMPRLKGFRFPREIIAYAVWAYHVMVVFFITGCDSLQGFHVLGFGLPLDVIAIGVGCIGVALAARVGRTAESCWKL